MPSRLLILLVTLLPVAHAAEDFLATRNWTSSEGKKLRATLTRASATGVTLKIAKTGKVVDIPLNRLSEADRTATTKWLNNDLNETNLAKVRKLTELAKSWDITVSQLALAWVLRRDEVTAAIIGATIVGQLEENVMASSIAFDDDELVKIEEILDNNPLA